MAMPKISCLTATLNRLVRLKESIRCYCDQTYPNREMIIATEGTQFYKRAIADYVASLERNDIKLVFLEGDDYNLGKVRNILLETAQGDIICQWDDDDLYHPERLRVQAEHMNKNKTQACVMSDQLHFFWESREMFWVNWADEACDPLDSLIPGTLMMRKDSRFRYPEDGSLASAHEDSAMLASLFNQVKLAALQGAGYLYVYIYHGTNTFDLYHHQEIALYRTGDAELALKHESQVKQALQYYRLPRPYALKVRGS